MESDSEEFELEEFQLKEFDMPSGFEPEARGYWYLTKEGRKYIGRDGLEPQLAEFGKHGFRKV